MHKVIYTRHGKHYVKVDHHGVIKEGAMQSWCGGGLQPITNADGETIGHMPCEFSDEREFYNPA